MRAASIAGVVAAYDPDRAGGRAQFLGDLADVLAGQPEQLLALGQAVAAAHPQLALAVEPELAVVPVRARQQVRGGLVAAAVGRLEDEHGVLRLVAGEVDVLGGGAEGVVGVVGPGAQVARGHHDPLAGEARGQRGAAGGGVRRLRDRLEAVPLGVGPAGLHDSGQFVGDGGVEPVLALL